MINPIGSELHTRTGQRCVFMFQNPDKNLAQILIPGTPGRYLRKIGAPSPVLCIEVNFELSCEMKIQPIHQYKNWLPLRPVPNQKKISTNSKELIS